MATVVPASGLGGLGELSCTHRGLITRLQLERGKSCGVEILPVAVAVCLGLVAASSPCQMAGAGDAADSRADQQNGPQSEQPPATAADANKDKRAASSYVHTAAGYDGYTSYSGVVSPTGCWPLDQAMVHNFSRHLRPPGSDTYHQSAVVTQHQSTQPAQQQNTVVGQPLQATSQPLQATSQPLQTISQPLQVAGQPLQAIAQPQPLQSLYGYGPQSQVQPVHSVTLPLRPIHVPDVQQTINTEVTHQVAVPHPVPVPQVKTVHVPYAVHVPVRVPEPYPVHVPVHVVKTVMVPVEKHVPYPVEKPYPVAVEKKVPIPVPVLKPYPVPVSVYKIIYKEELDKYYRPDKYEHKKFTPFKDFFKHRDGFFSHMFNKRNDFSPRIISPHPHVLSHPHPHPHYPRDDD
ncbi:Filamentous hemagglutinin [Frankliniella fusca]|uniref:Filamentous hemagglutinin n=1 Tax=Frankliniella fusca TaxID=407009 RepID=A0AAE1LBS6_9NEOP|nr:Filamentous hemagglutinin [Frankliniella fusca]